MSERERCPVCGRWPCGYCGACHLCEELARTAANGSPARSAAASSPQR